MTEIGLKHPREYDPGFLAFLRLKPCCLCGTGPSQACHIRSGSIAYDKRAAGMAEKPDDKWAIPMCRQDHTAQHRQNELEFWRVRGIDPFALAQKYYAQYQGQGGGPTTTKKPKSKPFPKSQRKIPTRSFR